MWNWDYAISIFPQLFQVLKVTVGATFGGFVLAAVLGLFLALGRRSRFKPLSWLTGGYIEFVRTTPLLIQLYFLFYVLPSYGISLPALTVGVIGLGLHFSTYLSEEYRAGIDSVPREQWEAAAALNLSRAQTWRRIILPQAIPPIIPALGNYLILMFKETPLLAAITVVELLATAQQIGSETFRYLEPFTIVGGLFLLISYPVALAIRRLNARVNRDSVSLSP